MKLDMDDCVDNIMFTNVLNFCLRPATTSTPIRPAPDSKYTNAVLDRMLRDNPTLSVEQTLLVSYDIINFYERVFLINIVEFDILIPHEVHYFYCACDQCAPLQTVYYACAHYLRYYPVSMVDDCAEMECLCNPGVSVCQPIPSIYSFRLRSAKRRFDSFHSVQITHWFRKLLSYEYVNFTKTFYKRLQYQHHQAKPPPITTTTETTSIPIQTTQAQINPSSPTNHNPIMFMHNDFFNAPLETPFTTQSTLIMT